jgi:indolepyruvate decarboxylase
MNNASWEMLRVFQPESRFNTLEDWHFAEIAAPLGGGGTRVVTRRELATALERAAATRGRFQLIEAVIPPGAVSPTLEGFVGALKRRQRR